MTTYRLTNQNHVIRDGTDVIPTGGTPDFLNTNADFIEYRAWLAAGNVPLPAVLTSDELAAVREQAFDELRETRAPMLNAVSGIMGDAIFRGDVEMAEEAAAIRQKLLDVTKDPLLLSASTYADMKLAGQYAYRKIANAASSGFKSVFKETTGA